MHFVNLLVNNKNSN